MMKILIIGGTSFIGSKFVEKLKKEKFDVHFTCFNNCDQMKNGVKLDISNKKQVLENIKNINPELIIHLASITNVEQCDTNKELSNSINVIGTKNISEAAQKNNSRIIYFSTSYVFDGSKKELNEKDVASPTSQYGITKLKGEEIIKKVNNSLILRIDQPYGLKEKWQHTNSVLRVIRSLKANQSFKEITNWYNTPIYVPNLVDVTINLIKKNATGIFHLVGDEYLSRYEWAMKIAEIFELNKNLIIPINSADLKLSVKRPNVKLSNKKLNQMYGIKIMKIEDGLLNMKESNQY